MQSYPEGGVYLLKIKLDNKKEIKVGALGKENFASGYYFYTGTAQRNLKARIERHYSSEKKLHWHIDYLLAEAELEKDFVFELPAEGECFLAQILKKNGGRTLINGFGSSDCSCDSHLIYFSLSEGKNILENLIKSKDLELEFKNFK
jgi:Uri superfamily endonuclease